MKCKFHPVKTAEYHCHYCETYLCANCTDEGLSSRRDSVVAHCYICEGELDAQTSSSEIIPFWSRIKGVYQYPLSTQAVVSILTIALLSVVLDGFGILGLLPLVAMALYAFSCLRHTARGEQNAPGVEACFEGSVAPVFYVGICMFLAIFLTSFAFSQMGYGMGIIVGLVMAVVVPAMIIIIAIEEQLASALNPSNLLNIVSTTGSSYFVMVLFIVVMLSSMEVLSGFLGNTNFRGLSVFISSVIANYYTIVIYHIMGYLVYQHHVELGHSVSGKAVVSGAVRKQNASEKQNARFELLIKAGKFDQAREIARERLSPETPIWEWNRAFKLFCAATPSKDVEKYFDLYVDRLEELNDVSEIADAYMTLCRVKPNFKPEVDSRKLLVAESLQQVGRFSASVGIIHKIPLESSEEPLIKRALALLINGFQNIPGSEKHLTHYQKLEAVHRQRIKA